jgi:uncharacterized protein (TIGR02246 family)
MKFKASFTLVILSMAFFLASCKGSQEQTERVEEEEPVPVMDVYMVREAIEAVNARFMEAVRLGDTAAIAELYTEDARLLPPESEMIQGREGIEAYWSGGIQMGLKDVVLTSLDVFEMGRMACEIGKYGLTIQPEGQEAVEDSGKYVVIWKQESDGTWKLYVDIWNTNMPASNQPPI